MFGVPQFGGHESGGELVVGICEACDSACVIRPQGAPVAALDAVLDAAREITQKRYQIGEEIPHYLYVTLQDAVRAYDAHGK